MDTMLIASVETEWAETLNQLEEKGELRSISSLRHRGRFVAFEERPKDWMVNLSGNDYLGLASKEALGEAFLAEQAGMRMSSSSSRLLTGNDPIYQALEAELEQSYGKPALLFNSGYHANLGILPALCDVNTLVLADKLVHASLVDGIRLSRATVHRFRHNDLKHLSLLLKKHATSYSRIFLVTESIFSMDGDLAPLHEYIALKRDYPKLLLYVDEAHALGVRGEQGLGYCEELDCIAEVDILVGTFGKALASMGAFVVCSAVIKKILTNRMRTLIYSTQLPPLQAAWTIQMWKKMKTMQQERLHLRALAEQLSQGQATSHIVPYIIGDSRKAIRIAEQLQSLGFFVLPVRPPTVPQGTSRLRFSLSAAMQVDEIDELTQILSAL